METKGLGDPCVAVNPNNDFESVVLELIMLLHNKLGTDPKELQGVLKKLDEVIGQVSKGNSWAALPRSDDSWQQFLFEETHNSTAIEQNTLSLYEVGVLLEDGKALGNKKLVEYMEVRGYAAGANWVYDQKPLKASHVGDVITLAELRSLHHMVLSPVWDVEPVKGASEEESPGNFRRHQIRAFSDGMTPPPWTQVDADIRTWIDELKTPREGEHPIMHAARMHARFEQIHPFIDGNGRTGRALLNLQLIRTGYPPCVIRVRDRDKYIDSLGSAFRNDFVPIATLVAREVTNSLYRLVNPKVLDPLEVQPLENFESDDFKVTAMRTAIQRGRLQAFKDASGQWQTSRAWIVDYENGKYRRENSRSLEL